VAKQDLTPFALAKQDLTPFALAKQDLTPFACLRKLATVGIHRVIALGDEIH